MTLLICLFLAAFTIITYRRFNIGVGLFFLLLPTYLVRYSFGPLPTTLLENMLWIIVLVWGIRMIQTQQSIKKSFVEIFQSHKLLVTSTILFIVAATIALFFAIDLRAALGEWKAFYIEPVFFASLIYSSLHQKKSSPLALHAHTILVPLLLCGIATSFLAIYQHFTGWMVPHAFWANGNSYRVTAWYGFPNGVGLFLSPLVPIALYYALTSIKKIRAKNRKTQIQDTSLAILSMIALIVLPLAVLFAKSTGGLIGIAGAIGLLLLLYKKTRVLTLVVGIISLLLLFALPQLDPVQTEVTFQDRSGQIRLAIYNETLALLHDNPIVGTGLASYGERIAPYHQTVHGEGIEIFHHPHNIFLTMWVNLGLLGLVSFIGIIGTTLASAFRSKRTYMSDLLSIFLLASFTTILITGLVDSPYIKNDLAILFWILIVLITVKKRH